MVRLTNHLVQISNCFGFFAPNQFDYITFDDSRATTSKAADSRVGENFLVARNQNLTSPPSSLFKVLYRAEQDLMVAMRAFPGAYTNTICCHHRDMRQLLVVVMLTSIPLIARAFWEHKQGRRTADNTNERRHSIRPLHRVALHWAEVGAEVVACYAARMFSFWHFNFEFFVRKIAHRPSIDFTSSWIEWILEEKRGSWTHHDPSPIRIHPCIIPKLDVLNEEFIRSFLHSFVHLWSIGLSWNLNLLLVPAGG